MKSITRKQKLIGLYSPIKSQNKSQANCLELTQVWLSIFFYRLFSERCGWIPNQNEIPESIATDYRWVNGLSVTEMEIMHGAYRKDNINCEYFHQILCRAGSSADEVKTF